MAISVLPSTPAIEATPAPAISVTKVRKSRLSEIDMNNIPFGAGVQ